MYNEESDISKQADKDLEAFSSDLNDYMIDMSFKAHGIFNDLLDKAKRLQNKEEFQKDVDEFALRLADTAWKQAHKHQDRELKERQVKKEEISMFHQMLKDANSGNLEEKDIVDV